MGNGLSTFPFTKLNLPVSITALLGAQIEFVTKPLLKIAPSFANLSILGVLFKL